MEHWSPAVIHPLATKRHREDIARGESAQRQAAQRGAQIARARIAAPPVALAARLAPERPAAT